MSSPKRARAPPAWHAVSMASRSTCKHRLAAGLRIHPVVKTAGLVVLAGSAAVLAGAGILWVVVPSWRPAIAAVVLISPIPPVP